MTGISDPILSVSDLDVDYDGVSAIQAVSLVIRRGRITTIIGSNGAGKSTLLKTIAGLLKPSAGSILFDGKKITGLSADAVVAEGISLVPEGRRLFSSMTVRENLAIGAYRRNDKEAIKRDLDRVLSYFPVLAERLEAMAGFLSGGQQQMVAVGRSLMSDPRLLMLDEPSIGLAPVIVETISAIIRAISKDGIDVLLVEQNAQMALHLSEDAYVMENGEIVMSGASADLVGSEQVRQAYLGI